VLIDELSRSDPGRVFGELLTYMERTRRDEPFLLASGDEVSLPDNVVFIATMNSRDKSVAEIDDAFDRRMAKVDFPPSVEILEDFLKRNLVSDELRAKIVGFFRWVNDAKKYPLGHTFFRTVKDEVSLRRLWETQLRFTFEKQYKYEPDVVKEIRDKFVEITQIAVA
jgi:5-methylcytosine-specific restriction protein B